MTHTEKRTHPRMTDDGLRAVLRVQHMFLGYLLHLLTGLNKGKLFRCSFEDLTQQERRVGICRRHERKAPSLIWLALVASTNTDQASTEFTAWFEYKVALIAKSRGQHSFVITTHSQGGS